ncbi:adenylate kinase [subsurface metagenome]
MKKLIIFYGPPGAGKSTILQKLEEIDLAFKKLAMADIVNEIINNQFEGYEIVQEAISQGELIPDRYIDVKVKEVFSGDHEILLFDGYPRNLKQTQFILDISVSLQIFIFHFKVKKANSIKRIKNRRLSAFCSLCHNVFDVPFKDCNHVISLSSYNGKRCPVCNGELYIRKNDTTEIVEKRYTEYLEKKDGILTSLGKSGKLFNINADQNKDQVYSQVYSEFEKIIGG